MYDETSPIEGRINCVKRKLKYKKIDVKNLIFTSQKTSHLWDGLLTLKNGKIMGEKDIVATATVILPAEQLAVKIFTQNNHYGYKAFLLMLCMLLFAFTTAVSWSYYVEVSIEYLVGKSYTTHYRILYAILFFLGTIIKSRIL